MTRNCGLVARAWFALVAVGVLVGSPACRKQTASESANAADPPITLKPDSAGLLLTWIDEKGDFHVEDKVADVPITGRDAVRVVDPTREDGTHSDRIFVADLRLLKPDGSYSVRVTTRAEFDALALARREQKGPTLAGVAPSAGGPTAPSAGASADATGRVDPNANGRPAVIIYGAEWCGPCHEAMSYFRSKGIAYVDKDIETDHEAAREMQAKLSRAGLRGGSIPVLDVRGKILVGFNARAVDDALGKAL